jgi:hypothetical protein
MYLRGGSESRRRCKKERREKQGLQGNLHDMYKSGLSRNLQVLEEEIPTRVALV